MTASSQEDIASRVAPTRKQLPQGTRLEVLDRAHREPERLRQAIDRDRLCPQMARFDHDPLARAQSLERSVEPRVLRGALLTRSQARLGVRFRIAESARGPAAAAIVDRPPRDPERCGGAVASFVAKARDRDPLRARGAQAQGRDEAHHQRSQCKADPIQRIRRQARAERGIEAAERVDEGDHRLLLELFAIDPVTDKAARQSLDPGHVRREQTISIHRANYVRTRAALV
jgi:hypothetical protein